MGISLELNQFQCKLTFSIVLSIYIEVPDFCILLIFKFKQYKNVDVANFVYYGKTPMCSRGGLYVREADYHCEVITRYLIS